MPRMLLTPLAWISLMMGRTLAANASAASLRAFMDALRAAARRGPPSLTPRRLAACSAASPAAPIRVQFVCGSAGSAWTGCLTCRRSRLIFLLNDQLRWKPTHRKSLPIVGGGPRFHYPAADKADYRHRLLRPCRERPHGGRAAEHCDERAAPHSITSSARVTFPTCWTSKVAHKPGRLSAPYA